MPKTGEPSTPLILNAIRACRRRRRTLKIADSTGAELTGGELLARALVLRRLLRRHVLGPDDGSVGVLLPPTAAAAVTNLALSLDRRVTVNLNYTLTAEILNACLAQAGVRRVITSRQFLQKVPLRLAAEMVCLEDLRERPTLPDKVIGAFLAYAAPERALTRGLGLDQVSPEALLSVLFTSGSTGGTKGAMLSHENVVAIVESVGKAIRLYPDDVLIGVLPFFHAFGYAITLWAALCLDIAAAYHPNPLDARGLGRLVRERSGTILLATPMFLRNYELRCEPADFATLDVVITGGERLAPAVSDAFERRFGLRPVEGYGCTEATSLISANVPPARAFVAADRACRAGTVGRPLPGVRVNVTDLETGDVVPPGQQGMLWVSGRNVMKGYLGSPETTAAVIRDGWYKTGDIVTIDAQGFIRIVGRESRFAKVGGEMVPLDLVEEALANLVGAGSDDDGPRLVVVSVPDHTKGERLVVVHTGLPRPPGELRRGLSLAGLPAIFTPSEDSFVQVDELPTIGIGKLDLERIAEIARAAASRRRVRSTTGP